jgi:hypothetical protein
LLSAEVVEDSLSERPSTTTLVPRPMTGPSEKTTLKRADDDPIVIVGASSDAPPSYIEALQAAGYEVALVPTPTEGARVIAAAMPRVVVLSTSVPMPDHRLIHEAAIAVCAEVLILAPDSDGLDVAESVDRASARATKRRGG